MAIIDTPGQAPAHSARTKWLALLGVGLGVFMGTLDGSIVNVALPTLTADLGASFATVQWVVVGYLLSVTGLLLGVARLGDLVGKRSVYLGGLVIFTLGSLLCGLSTGVPSLVASRVVQGLGASAMMAMGAAILTEVFPPKERGKALGTIGAVVSLGIAVGPTLGGLLLGAFGWRSIFLVNVPVGAVTVGIVARVVPRGSKAPSRHGFDFAGAAVLTLSLGAYAFGMTAGQRSGFGSPLALGLLLGAVALLVAFVVIERRTREPVLDLSLFRNPLLSANLGMGVLVFIVLAGQALLMPFFLSLVRGYSSERVGLLLATLPVCMAVSSPLSGALSDRFGPRGISLLGLVLTAAGCLLVSTLPETGPASDFVVRVIPTGIGFGMFQAPNNSAIMGAVPRDKLGVGSGLLSLSRTLGQSTGFPLMGSIYGALVAGASGGAEVTSAPKPAMVVGLAGTFHIAALIVLGAVALAALAWALDRRGASAEAGAGAEG